MLLISVNGTIVSQLFRPINWDSSLTPLPSQCFSYNVSKTFSHNLKYFSHPSNFPRTLIPVTVFLVWITPWTSHWSLYLLYCHQSTFYTTAKVILLKQKSLQVIVLLQISELLLLICKRQYFDFFYVNYMIWLLLINSASSCLFSLRVLFSIVHLFHFI